MITPISTKDKQSFIKWFLHHYKMKRRESKWILEFLVDNNALLKNVHFVRDVKHCPKAIIISSVCSEGMPFIFYKEKIVTEDFEKLFHDLRLNQCESLYIQLNFYNSIQNALYVSVLEENPHLPVDLKEMKRDRSEANRILQYTLIQKQRELLKQKINFALDDSDQTSFITLAKQLEDLELRIKEKGDE